MCEETRPLRSGLLRRSAAAEVMVMVDSDVEDDDVGAGATEATRVVIFEVVRRP